MSVQLIPSNRFGMVFRVTKLSAKLYKEGYVRYCQACNGHFKNVEDALTHPCSKEEEFRKKFNRPVNLDSRPRFHTEQVIKSVPEKAVTFELDVDSFVQRFTELKNAAVQSAELLTRQNNIIGELQDALRLRDQKIASLEAQIVRVEAETKRKIQIQDHLSEVQKHGSYAGYRSASKA